MPDRTPWPSPPRNLTAELVDRGDGRYVSPELLAVQPGDQPPPGEATPQPDQADDAYLAAGRIYCAHWADPDRAARSWADDPVCRAAIDAAHASMLAENQRLHDAELRAIDKLNRATDLLIALVDDDPCQYDHEGRCKTHLYGDPCGIARALAFIEEMGRG